MYLKINNTQDVNNREGDFTDQPFIKLLPNVKTRPLENQHKQKT